MKATIAAVVIGSLVLGGALVSNQESSPLATVWRRAVNPGKLSRPHAFLEHDCDACHTPTQGVLAANCIVCHANNESLLARQPTAFHATIGSCKECHAEHLGRALRPIQMDHAALVQIAARRRSSQDTHQAGADELVHAQETAPESQLNCSACHSKEDPHSGQFGLSCGACHITDRWTVPDFRHPSPRSRDCAECHFAPPCHHTSHFRNVCAQVAGQPDAQVNHCFSCHQTTAWNDIKGVGWYKSH